MGVNTKYKDSVFSFLFSDPDRLRELYSALEGISLPPDVPITINTLQDVLFMDRINDISFVIDHKLVVLVEHQSTINPNMALRLLLYIDRVYEKIIDQKKIYSTRPIIFPRPEFFVLYNGTAEYPDQAVLKLSDLYENVESLGLPEKIHSALELEVKVFNINPGRNEEIIKRSKTLWSYSAFIWKLRDHIKEGINLKEAMKRTIEYCVEHDILKDFFKEHATEVINMLITEWNIEDALAVRYEEGREEGREEVARNALAMGFSVEVIRNMTGLDIETIINFRKE